jgi:type I restriction enzyme S subunit
MPGEVPQGWREVRIGNIAREVSKRNRTGDDIPVLSMTKHRGFVRSDEYFSKSVYSENTENYKLVRRGQFAYATIHLDEGSIDYLKNYDAGLISPMYTVFEVNSADIEKDIAYRNFKRFALSGRFEPYSNGGVNRRKSILFSDLAAFKFAIPPLAEQRAITEVLGKVEEAIAKTEALIEAIGESRVELTREFQGSEETPKWPLRSIGSLIRQCQYGLSIPLDGEGSVPVLRMPDIEDGRVNVDIATLKTADVTPSDIASCAVRNGDILFNRTNSQALVGKTGIVRACPKAPIVFASYLIRIVANSGVNPFWLNGVLNLPRTQKRLKTLATPGVSQWNINSKTLKRFEIAVPPKVDQSRFADLYEAIESRLEAERDRLAALIDARAALAQELLSGRKRLPETIIARHRDKAGQAA